MASHKDIGNMSGALVIEFAYGANLKIEMVNGGGYFNLEQAKGILQDLQQQVADMEKQRIAYDGELR